MQQRFGDAASIHYHDVSQPEVASEYAEVIRYIKDNSLIYPVTVIDGVPIYEGAVSYPGILRAVQAKLHGIA